MGCYSKQGSRLGCSLSGGMRVGDLGVDLGLAQYCSLGWYAQRNDESPAAMIYDSIKHTHIFTLWVPFSSDPDSLDV